MGNVMPNMYVEVERDYNRTLVCKTNLPLQGGTVRVHFTIEDQYSKPFEISCKISEDKNRIFITWKNPFTGEKDSRWFERFTKTYH